MDRLDTIKCDQMKALELGETILRKENRRRLGREWAEMWKECWECQPAKHTLEMSPPPSWSIYPFTN